MSDGKVTLDFAFDVAIHDMEQQSNIMSNAGMETPLYASQS